MVKITNAFGDEKRGVQGEAVYQMHYGNQIRRAHKEHKDADTVTQHLQRDRFRAGIDFWKNLTRNQKLFLKSYMAEAGITNPERLPTTLYSFTKKIAMTVPEVGMETEAGEGGFTGTYAAWTYRKPITLTNGGSAQSNYQALITLTTENFDYSKCKNDGGDIRFAASNGSTPLNYWIKDWNYNGTSKIRVKVDSIPGGSNVCLYVYYDKADATSESNKEATMLLWDPFDNADKWTISDTNDIIIADGKLKVLSTCNSAETAYITDKPTLGNDWVLKFTYKKKAELSGERASTFGVCDAIQYNDSGNEIFVREYDDGSNTLLTRSIVEGTLYSGTNLNNPVIDELYTIQFKKLGNSVNIKIWDTSHSEANPNTDDDLPAKDSYEFPYISLGLRSTGGDEGEFDDITIRKYASPEPTSEFGTEETGGEATKLKAFNIHHPAIKSYEIINTGIKEESLSNLEDHISTVVTRKNLDLVATAIKVVTLAEQEYTFPVK